MDSKSFYSNYVSSNITIYDENIPDSFFDIDKIESLSLHWCEKLTKIPEKIGNFIRLKNLTIKETPIVELPQSLSNLNLESFEFSSDNFLPPSGIENLKTLKKLTIKCPLLKEFPKAWYNLSELSELILIYTPIKSFLESVSLLHNLETIEIAIFDFDKLPVNIGLIPNLQKINIYSSSINDFSELSNVRKLKEIKIVDTPISNMQYITNLKNLTKICLLNTKISEIPEDIEALTNLEEFEIGSEITEDFEIVKPEKSKIITRNYKYSQYRDYFEPIIPEGDFSESEMVTLYLCSGSGNIKRFCEFKSEKIKALPESIFNLKKIMKLDISLNNVESISGKISNLENLTHLIISDNNINCLPENIGKLKKLEYLKVSRNKLTTIPESISNLSNLDHLDISYNNIQKIPSDIGRMKKLKYFLVNSNKLTELPESLNDIDLRQIHISNNSFIKFPINLINKIYTLHF